MQLPEESDATGFVNANLPPQAQTGLPGMAADLADIAPAPNAEQTLLQSAFGDKGAQQYTNLRNAGRAAPVPAGAPPEIPPLVNGVPDVPGLARPGSVPDLISAALAPASTWNAMNNEREMRFKNAMAMQEEFRRNASEFYATLMPAVFKAFPGRPDLAAINLTNQAAQRGLQIDPTVLIKLDQDTKEGKMTYADLGKAMSDPKTPIQTLVRLGASLKTIDEFIKAHAEAQDAVTKAAANAAPPGAYPTNVAEAKSQQQLVQAGLEIATKIRTLQRPPTPTEIDTLAAAGLEAYQVPVSGVPGASMWSTRPKSAQPGGAAISSSGLHDIQADKAAQVKRAQTAASPLPVGVVDKLAGYDTALDIINQLKTLYAKGSPTDQERQNWFNRVKQEVQYRWGFDMPENLDEDTALRSLGAITAGRAFIQGRPNQQLMNEIWKHTGQNPLVSPDQMRDRLKIMEHQVRSQKDAMTKYTQMGREDLATGEETPPPGSTTTTTTPSAGTPNVQSEIDNYINSFQSTP